MTNPEPPRTDVQEAPSGGAPEPSPQGTATRASGAAETRDLGEPQLQRDADEGDSIGSFLRELPVLIIVAFVLAFLLRTFVVQVFYIPSSSMEPTLQVNDRILVDKVTYRFRDVRRGEIVVFEGEDTVVGDDGSPLRNLLRGLGQLVGLAPANAKDFVKRVVGLPGDEIRIDDDGVVYVNGQALDEPYVEFVDAEAFGPVTVPEGRLFFLGDNRPNSSDSRESLGFVDRSRVVGKAFLVIWPFGRFHLLDSADYARLEAATSRWSRSPPVRAAGSGGLAAVSAAGGRAR